MVKAFGFVGYGGPEQQEFLDRPTPAPGPGTLRIRVVAAGVNPADWKKRQGRFGTDAAPPVVMGSEAAGVVTALGADVRGFRGGDEVFGTTPDGAFAEEALLTARYPLERAAEAMAEVEGGHARGKLILEMSRP
ncbi:hypothetical protein GCM10009759_65930 [Kitasatospora saccharophila]|uniref:Alcohol dehydrogenase-like N-terminal domain-containing protein n=1 Tax=Kitasatospora saccharophila TaxID=407973 RepID=A0ABP5JIL6_9ACTN